MFSQPAVPLKLRFSAPLCRLVFQACGLDAADTEDDYFPLSKRGSPLRLRRDGLVERESAAGFQLPRLSGSSALSAVFVIAFAYEITCSLSSQKNVVKQKMQKRRFFSCFSPRKAGAARFPHIGCQRLGMGV